MRGETIARSNHWLYTYYSCEQLRIHRMNGKSALGSLAGSCFNRQQPRSSSNNGSDCRNAKWTFAGSSFHLFAIHNAFLLGGSFAAAAASQKTHAAALSSGAPSHVQGATASRRLRSKVVLVPLRGRAGRASGGGGPGDDVEG